MTLNWRRITFRTGCGKMKCDDMVVKESLAYTKLLFIIRTSLENQTHVLPFSLSKTKSNLGEIIYLEYKLPLRLNCYKFSTTLIKRKSVSDFCISEENITV